MCFSTKAESILFLCTFTYSLLSWVCVFCPYINLQCILLFADVFLGRADVSARCIPVFHTEGTSFGIHSCSDCGDKNCC